MKNHFISQFISIENNEHKRGKLEHHQWHKNFKKKFLLTLVREKAIKNKFKIADFLEHYKRSAIGFSLIKTKWARLVKKILIFFRKKSFLFKFFTSADSKKNRWVLIVMSLRDSRMGSERWVHCYMHLTFLVNKFPKNQYLGLLKNVIVELTYKKKAEDWKNYKPISINEALSNFSKIYSANKQMTASNPATS